MNKRELATLAVIGATAITTGCQKGTADHGEEKHMDDEQHNTNNQHDMSAEKKAFYETLSVGGKRKFMELDEHHQAMAMEMAHQSCNGQNECAGMGGCKSAHNACAGKNGCKGQGGEPVKDPNKAVMVQLMKQSGER
ncbi:MAG: hypothetical protein S4CHLAM81_09170 [Chlamydiales bacterium]|nr:hypothetical protein [Chlamydiales bacterium]MCH9635696.1 hypothetical protein [Chlamydiales bacterium]MCH9704495.1 hypothetical protein [Chlamydiota bacterium]